MSLSGILVKSTPINSNADAFIELFRYTPYLIPEMSPMNITGVDLIDGEWGSVGSVLLWNYLLDGNELIANEVLEATDEENKEVCFKVLDGALMDLYKRFLLNIHVNQNGEETIVTWTLIYEKLNENVEDPNSLMEFCLRVTKDIETQQLKASN